MWNFPNCCGAIDGKQIKIVCPDNSGSLYFDYKSFFSIVLLAVIDYTNKFMVVDIGSYGKEYDAGIFPKSNLGKLISNGQFKFPEPRCLPNTNILLPHVFIAIPFINKHLNLKSQNPRLSIWVGPMGMRNSLIHSLRPTEYTHTIS